MLREGWCDREYIRRHTENFERARLSLATAAAICGIAGGTDLSRRRGCSRRRSATLSLYCQGLNQSSSGTAKNAALINLHLATGQIGKPGAGPFSLTGQPNAMGGREVGGMANLLSAHRDLSNPEHREEIAALWGVRSVPERPGKTAVEMFEAVRRGEIKAVWIACTNPAQSLPDQKLVHKALERAELVVVQDAYRNTETAPTPTCFLPAAGLGGEGGHGDQLGAAHLARARRRAAAGRGAGGLADRGGFRQKASGRRASCFRTRSPKRSSTSIARPRAGATSTSPACRTRCSTSAGRSSGRFRQGAATGRKRLYEDGVFPTPSGRARFVPTPFTPVAEDTDDDYPLRLTTGRLRDQWHSMSRTGTIASAVRARAGAAGDDASGRSGAAWRLKRGELVRITSRRGEVFVRAAADADLCPGTVFLAMHWGGRFLGGRGVNALTIGALDPVSRQPELKHCAVRIEAARLPWRLVASAPAANACALMQEIEPVMRGVPYALRTLDGTGVRLSLAAEKPVSQQVLKWLGVVFEQGTVEVGDAALAAARGRTLCNCFGVAESEIDAFAAASKSLAELQAKLRVRHQLRLVPSGAAAQAGNRVTAPLA